MGVRGLKTFITNNSSDLFDSSYQLHDTHLVIDGDNLLSKLYWQSSSSLKDYKYGGDYSRYATLVRSFFKTLTKCEIIPIVVLDGGLELPKLPTVLKRNQQRLNNVKLISKYNTSSEIVFPLLLKDIFIAVLKDMEISFVRCLHEADSSIAMLANQLDCPVLSDDSDFFIYHLKGGVVSSDSLINDWRVIKTRRDVLVSQDNGSEHGHEHGPEHDEQQGQAKSIKYLSCSLYHIQNLLDFFPGLSSSSLPLFSTLMGNDYVNTHVFDNIFNGIPGYSLENFSKRKSKGLHVGKRQERMVKLLNWLREKSVDQAIDWLIRFLKTNSRDKAIHLLKYSLDNYKSGSQSQSGLIKYLVNQEKSRQDKGKNKKKIRDKKMDEEVDETQEDPQKMLDNLMNSEEIKTIEEDSRLPSWFVLEYHEASLIASVMNVVNLKINFLHLSINDFSLLSSQECALRLRRCAYGLLRGNDYQEGEGDDNGCVFEYDRKENSISKNSVSPIIELKLNEEEERPEEICTIKFPNLFQIRSLTLDERRNILIKILLIDEDFFVRIKTNFEPFLKHKSISGESLSFLIGVISYWVKKASKEAPIWIEFMLSLLLIVLFSGYLDENSGSSKMNLKYFALDPNELAICMPKVKKFDCLPTHNNKDIFKPRIVHFYNQLQACLQAVLTINSIMAFPIQQFPFVCFNGIILYNLTCELSSRKDPHLYLAELIGRRSSVVKVYDKLVDLVVGDLKDQSEIFVRANQSMHRKDHVESQLGKKVGRGKKGKANKSNQLFNNRFAKLNLTQ